MTNVSAGGQLQISLVFATSRSSAQRDKKRRKLGDACDGQTLAAKLLAARLAGEKRARTAVALLLCKPVIGVAAATDKRTVRDG